MKVNIQTKKEFDEVLEYFKKRGVIVLNENPEALFEKYQTRTQIIWTVIGVHVSFCIEGDPAIPAGLLLESAKNDF